MKQKRAKIGFTGCATAYIRSLQEEGRYSTAHVYKNAVLSFTRFHGSTYIAFEQITRESLRRYGQYLYDCKLKLNTISTYMRMLRCIYNRGVEAGIARFIPRLFRDVYTGVDVRQKKAMPVKDCSRKKACPVSSVSVSIWGKATPSSTTVFQMAAAASVSSGP